MSTDDSVYITDMENKIIFVNRAFHEAYGYEEQEIIGKDSNILWMGKQRKGTRSVFQMVSSAWEVGFYHKRKDGSVFPVSLTRSIIKDSVGNEVAVVGVARDISDYITMEDELRTANQTLERRSHLKSELAIAVSEELETLIAEVEKSVSYAASGKTGSDLKETMEPARQNISKARDIIKDFLEISNIDTNKADLDKTEFDLRLVVIEVVETLSVLASGKNIKLESSVPDSEFFVEGDRDKITHLINHSINTVPETSRINVRLEDRGNEVTVEVEDDGSTIEGGQMSKVFNRFDQIRAQLRAGREELLLDLPTARELVEMHGGWVLAESKGNKGNSFRFTLPKPNLQPNAASTSQRNADKEK
jgi:two-component system CheB/CheR fusion protein